MRNLEGIEPIFHVTDDVLELIKKIEKELSLIKFDNNDRKKNLRIKSRVRSIHSSLAIEANSLSLKSVENIVDKKVVYGNRKEIQEVKNANELYEHISDYDWRDEEDFLKAHFLMMKYLDDNNGKYRNHGEGIIQGKDVIYTAPQSILVPSFMKSLFKFINVNEKKIHPLILSSIFHYYFVYIHPFSDGNGRMARFWVSLMLTSWDKKFEYIPIEEEIYLNRQEYYDSIMKCHINGNANEFIYFMLNIICNLLEKTTQKTTQKIKLNKNQLMIIELIKANPKITMNEMTKKLNITIDGIKYNLRKLKNNGTIERVGPDNGGYWNLKS